MFKSERKLLLREQAQNTEPAYVDGVIIGVPTGATPEEIEELKEHAREIINDANSEFAQRRAVAKARRAVFDKRLAAAREMALAEIERANSPQSVEHDANA